MVAMINKKKISKCDNDFLTRRARPNRAPDFLKLLWLARQYTYVCVCVCVSTPEGINNQWRDMV